MRSGCTTHRQTLSRSAASSVSSNGRMEGGNPLPNNAGDYAKFIITRESTHPSHPGPTVLSGSFTLH